MLSEVDKLILKKMGENFRIVMHKIKIGIGVIITSILVNTTFFGTVGLLIWLYLRGSIVSFWIVLLGVPVLTIFTIMYYRAKSNLRKHAMNTLKGIKRQWK